MYVCQSHTEHERVANNQATQSGDAPSVTVNSSDPRHQTDAGKSHTTNTILSFWAAHAGGRTANIRVEGVK